jgi:WD40 repeat protein
MFKEMRPHRHKTLLISILFLALWGHVVPSDGQEANQNRDPSSVSTEGIAEISNVTTFEQGARVGNQRPSGYLHRSPELSAYAANGRYLVYRKHEDGLMTNTVNVLDRTKGFQNTHRHKHKILIHYAGITPDGRWLIAGSGTYGHGSVQVFDVQKGFQKVSKISQGSTLRPVRYLPDQGYLITPVSIRKETETSYKLRVMDLEKGGQDVHSLSQVGITYDLAVSPDHKWVAAGVYTVRILNAHKNFQVATSVTHPDSVGALAFSSDGQYLASGSAGAKEEGKEGVLHVVDPENPSEGTYRKTTTNNIGSLLFSPDGHDLVTQYPINESPTDEGVFRWSLDIHRIRNGIHTIRRNLPPEKADVRNAFYSPDNNYFVTMNRSTGERETLESISIYRVSENYEEVHRYSPDRYQLSDATFSPDGQYLLVTMRGQTSGNRFERLKVLDVQNKLNPVMTYANESSKRIHMLEGGRTFLMTMKEKQPNFMKIDWK